MRGFTEQYQQDIADEQSSQANKGRKGLGYSSNGLSGFVPAGYKPTPLNTRKKFGDEVQTNKSVVITNDNVPKLNGLVPSMLFPIVHAFLEEAGLIEVATLLKKSTSFKNATVKHSLLEIFQDYCTRHNVSFGSVEHVGESGDEKKATNGNTKKKAVKDSDDDSSDGEDVKKSDSSSDSSEDKKSVKTKTYKKLPVESSDSDTDSDEKKKPKKEIKKKKKQEESDSDSDLDDEKQKKKSKIVAKMGNKKDKKKKESDSDESDQEQSPKKNKANVNSKKRHSDSDSDEEQVDQKSVVKNQPKTKSDSDDQEQFAKKDKKSSEKKQDTTKKDLKRKRDEYEEVSQEDEETKDEGEEPQNKRQKVDKSTPKKNTPFKRVRVEEITFQKEELADNSYKLGQYGDKAYQDLKITKGKSFRQAKTKKKRGSYKGGTVDINAVRSVKF